MTIFKTLHTTGLTLLLLLTIANCGKQKKTAEESMAETVYSPPLIESDNDFIVSIYDTSEDIGSHKLGLKQLSENGIFSFIHKETFSQLIEKHKNHFKSKPEFELLYIAKGNLFLNEKNDCAFIVYDKKNPRIIILLYDESANKYSELYRDIKVAGELEDCNYSFYGTLDYIVGEEFINYGLNSEYLEDFMSDFKPCMITDVMNDSTFILDLGCFAKGISNQSQLNSLCIATSFVYSSWECLLYDKSEKKFKLVFGQAFSD
jgi:hypothetical protein